MKRLIIFIAIIVSAKGFSQETYVQSNAVQITDEKSFNETLSLNQILNLKWKHDLSTHNFSPKRNEKFITGKVNAYHFAVFEKDILITEVVDLKVEFHMDKYNNKMALLNVHIPLKFIQ
ncbi:hypothetical protein RXV94_13755 [Yeosuana sp. MJ-SS3]|uniref:DUF3887 domain-containing protein n=1 Tax=Gilvirhabdus luticola TaxID=3079858 RepID=A0ABU3UA57_9FLAO|nr:hypothetical protein [Yeosuana sp. MJ-SS3]MDU8887232.1 hypothetical protein [Yeosuana sp. MJ-SS3]